MRRFVLFCVGVIATGLAALGIVLPILPAAPFLIVALWAFSRSSTKMYRWLTRVPLFKHALVHADYFEKHGALTKGVKIFAQVCSWSSLLMFILLGDHIVVTITAFFAAVICTVVMRVIPTLKLEDIKDPKVTS